VDFGLMPCWDPRPTPRMHHLEGQLSVPPDSIRNFKILWTNRMQIKRKNGSATFAQHFSIFMLWAPGTANEL
jgi:hypothetical protein